VTTTAGAVDIAGLAYQIQITPGATPADLLVLRGNEGNDWLQAADGVEAVIRLNLQGNDGDDTLIGDGTLEGHAGDDRLTGYGGSHTLAGGTGNDIYLGGGGSDTILENPGEGNDTIAVPGTAGADAIQLATCW
jgi:Ca2+-binding RTX toxin-like protein